MIVLAGLVKEKVMIDFKNIPKPYTVVRKPGWWIYNGFYEVHYDETNLSGPMNKRDAEVLVGMLNGAFMNGMIEENFRNE